MFTKGRRAASVPEKQLKCETACLSTWVHAENSPFQRFCSKQQLASTSYKDYTEWSNNNHFSSVFLAEGCLMLDPAGQKSHLRGVQKLQLSDILDCWPWVQYNIHSCSCSSWALSCGVVVLVPLLFVLCRAHWLVSLSTRARCIRAWLKSGFGKFIFHCYHVRLHFLRAVLKSPQKTKQYCP